MRAASTCRSRERCARCWTITSRRERLRMRFYSAVPRPSYRSALTQPGKRLRGKPMVFLRDLLSFGRSARALYPLGGEAVLAPRFVDHDGDGVRQIEAAVTFA